MSPLKRHYLPFLLLLSLIPIFIFSHYFHTTQPTPQLQIHTQTHPNFTFTLKVLTFDRLPSLTRCLTSLSNAIYNGDRINLHIFIDHFNSTSYSPTDVGQKIQSFRKMLDFVDGFEWGFGDKLVIYRSVNVGLQAQWLESWWPNDDRDFVFVVEDDLELSPLYYLFLKKLILNYYFNGSNFSPWIYGASLQRPRFVPGKHGNKMELDEDTPLFLYQLVGTWGQLLFPRPWKEFRLWYDDHKARGIKPFLDGMVTTGWYKKMGERIWTPWFIKFIHSRGYFNFYTKFPNERALSISHRDAGVNYGKTVGPDSQLLDEKSVDITRLDMPPLSNLKWYDFCFKQIFPGRVAKKLDEVGPILQSMDKQKPVFLVSLSKASKAVTTNLICHFEKLNIQNYLFMAPMSDSDVLLDLERRGHPVIDTENVFTNIMRSQKSSLIMFKEIVVKAYVINRCLKSGFDIGVIDWNSLLLSDNPLVDFVDSGYDFYAGKDSQFFIARSSSSSRRIWDENFVLKFIQDLSLSENGDFVDVVAKYLERRSLKVKNVDDSSFSLKLESIGANQTVPTTTKMISWSSKIDLDSIQTRLQETGMWLIDGDESCKAVVCHQS